MQKYNIWWYTCGQEFDKHPITVSDLHLVNTAYGGTTEF